MTAMEQDSRVTVAWALRGLERALQDLGDGWAERRVRRQFHQLLLAVERDAHRQTAVSNVDESAGLQETA